MDNSKSELLSQLKIDKSEAEPQLVAMTALIATALGTLIVGMVLSYLIFGGSESQPSQVDTATEPQLETPVTKRLASHPNVDASETTLNASGYITARLIATVSAQVLGLITSVDVEEGMRVESNQVLAQLDDHAAKVNLDLAKAQVSVQEARLKSIKADLSEAQRTVKRISSLDTENFSSEADLTRARANLEKSLSALASAKADILVAKLNVAAQQEHFDNHTIRAPFAGVVTVKNAQPGEIVSPSSAGGGFTRTGICTIVDMDSLEIEVDVNEAFIGRVYPEQKVRANLDAYPKWDIPASVVAIIPTADRAKATVRVRIKLEIKDTRILPDMGVKVAFLK